MDWISDPTAWSALVALLTLEIVLGVDNVVFISILASKLPLEEQTARARSDSWPRVACVYCCCSPWAG